MIVPMKKVSLVVMKKDRETCLEKLREAGVIHLIDKDVSSDSLSKLLDRQALNKWALGYLSRYKVKGDIPAPSADYTPPEDLTDHIRSLVTKIEALSEQLVHLMEEKQQVEHWGEFNPHDFTFLLRHDIKLFPYLLPTSIYKKIGEEATTIVVSKDKNWVKALALNAEISGISPEKFPEIPLSEINNRIQSLQFSIGEIEAELKYLATMKKSILEENSNIVEELEFETVKVGMDTLEDAPQNLTICWLSGYVPKEKIDLVKSSAMENNWGVIWNDPDPEDKPPTQLKNNSVIRIIHPVFSMLGTIPGYREYDISFSYLVFLCIFFPLILGDAVYGILILLAGLTIGILSRKKGGDFPDPAKLLILLSSCTIVWGALNGAWFGVPTENLPGFLQMLILQPFNNTGPLAEFPLFLAGIFKLPDEVPSGAFKTQWNLQFLCFTIGMVQLVWARAKNMVKQLPYLTALAQAGWLIVIIGMYFLVLFMLLGVALPSFVPGLIATGIALNFIFGEQRGGNFAKNIGKSFANFFPIILKAIGCFGDIISYIRLFAVGMAGSIIIQTVNSMAIPSGDIGSFGLALIFRLFAALLILVFAHSLHLAINALSVIVHGLRLNLLEYAGNHLEIGWSGYSYKPFAFKQKK